MSINHYTLLPEHQVDQPFQGTSGSYNTYSEYDSAIQGQRFNMPQSVEGNLGYFDTIFDYDSAKQDQWLTNYFNQQQQEASSNSDMLWDYEIRQNCDYLVDWRRTYTEDNHNDYHPKNPVTVVFSDDDDDDDDDDDYDDDTDSMVNAKMGCFQLIEQRKFLQRNYKRLESSLLQQNLQLIQLCKDAKHGFLAAL